MVKRVEVLRKFILTFIEKVPNYLTSYTPSEQKFLVELLDLLQHCESQADKARGKLSERLENYCTQIRKGKEYYSTPFLWLTEIYFDNANLFLRVADFHAYNFYNFLGQVIRGLDNLPGIFQLIREGRSLQDLKWEKLQYYVINSFKFPLTEEELKTIKELYSYIYSAGINGFSQTSIANHLKTKGMSERKYKDFIQLLTLLDAGWNLFLHYPAFGLRHFYARFNVKKPYSLEDVVDFFDATNTTLCHSRIYRIGEFPNRFMGYLVVPEDKSGQLRNYFNECECQNKLKLEELTEIQDIFRSVSLSYYRAGKGWPTLSSKEIKELVQQLTVKHPRKLKKKPHALFHDTPYNHDWDYKQAQDPKKVISLLCKLQQKFSYETLPIDLKNDEFVFSRSEIEILESLIQKKLCQPFFILDRIHYEYSIDVCSIKTPHMPLKQISRILKALPYAHLSIMENSIVIWTPLSLQDRRWIKEDLRWETLQIIPYKRQQALDYDWFNPKTLQWNPPKIFEDL
ncbi:MAG: hypothetical protein ACFFDT_24355 [Candidatus Hodarchaeota archaeon]